MNWFKANWGWLIVVVLAIIPLHEVIRMINIDFSGISGSWISMDTFNMPARRTGEAAREISGAHMALKQTGEWAIRWVVIILSMTPFAILTGKKPSLWVRQAAGIVAFTYAGLHFLFFCIDKSLMETFKEMSFILGFIATLIMCALAITSNSRSMKLLRKAWKKLHRLAYLAAVLAVLHVALLEHGDWVPYLIILIIGFLVRTSFVKNQLLKIRGQNVSSNVQNPPKLRIV